MGEIDNMIDLHSHILFNLDDGAYILEESIEMCRISYHDGIRTIVATPHILPGIYENNRPAILSAVAHLNAALSKLRVNNDSTTQLPNNSARKKDPISQFLKDAANSKPHSGSGSGLQSTIDRSIDPRAMSLSNGNHQSPIKILPGADVHFSSDLIERLERKEIVSVNDQGRYLMVEFEYQGIPYKAEEVLFQMLTKGVVPIITHPERNMEIEKKPRRYYEMIRMGCLGQVTAMSLTGGFGRDVMKAAERLLAKRLIHIIASDAHSPHRRPPILSDGVKQAEKIVGKKEARKMVTEYPEAIIDGRRPNVPEPLSP